MPQEPDIRPPKVFPHCIVWTPIPIITWILPFVGHMGICDSSGLIHDFAGPFFINRGDLSFGSPTRYLVLHPDRASKDWDEGLARATAEYEQRMYNFCGDNCHCYVARFLNDIGYEGRRSWNMVRLATRMFFKGKHVGVGGFLRTWLPLCLLCGVGVMLAGIFRSK